MKETAELYDLIWGWMSNYWLKPLSACLYTARQSRECSENWTLRKENLVNQRSYNLNMEKLRTIALSREEFHWAQCKNHLHAHQLWFHSSADKRNSEEMCHLKLWWGGTAKFLILFPLVQSLRHSEGLISEILFRLPQHCGLRIFNSETSEGRNLLHNDVWSKVWGIQNCFAHHMTARAKVSPLLSMIPMARASASFSQFFIKVLQ